MLDRKLLELASALGAAAVLFSIVLGAAFGSQLKLNNVTQATNGTSTDNYTSIEQKTRAFLETIQKQGGPPIYTLSLQEARVALSKLQAAYPVAMLPADIENRTIPGGPNGEISINIVRPQGSSNDTLLPIVMYFHGGGWVSGDFGTHERFVRELANKANVAIVFVNYSRS